MKKESNYILEIKDLNVEFPIFGGILQREVSSVHAVKNFNLQVKLLSLISIKPLCCILLTGERSNFINILDSSVGVVFDPEDDSA